MSQTPDVLPIEFVTKAFTITVQESVKALSQVIMENIDNGCGTEDIRRLCKGIINWEYDYNPSPSEIYNEMVNLNTQEEEKKKLKKNNNYH